MTRRAGARQRGAPALLRIFAEGVGDDVVDDVRRGLEVDGQAPIRLGGSIAVEDGASEASLGDRGVGESGPLPSILWESFIFRWKASVVFRSPPGSPSASGVRHREGGWVSGQVRAHTGKFRAGNSPASMKRKCCRRKTSCVLRCTSCRGGRRHHSASRQEPRGRFQQTMSRRNSSPGSEDARLGRQLRGIRLSAPAGGRKSS